MIGKTLDWFLSYLREHGIYSGKGQGSNIFVKLDIPQGSILRTVLFLTHINDLSSVLSPTRNILHCCKLCKDDTSFWSEVNDELEAFAHDIRLVCCVRNKTALIFKLMVVLEEKYLWMDSNRLVINVDKSCGLFFTGSEVSIRWYMVSKHPVVGSIGQEGFRKIPGSLAWWEPVILALHSSRRAEDIPESWNNKETEEPYYKILLSNPIYNTCNDLAISF